MKKLNVDFLTRDGNPAVAEFENPRIRERKAGEPVHYHDDSRDPDDGRPFSAICGKCGVHVRSQDSVQYTPLVWTDRLSAWEEHPNRCTRERGE